MRHPATVVKLAAGLAGALLLSVTALALPPPGGGGGPGGGDQTIETPDYGDLFVLYRDASGIPILTDDMCQQPMAAEPFEGCIQLPGTTELEDCVLIPLDPDTCAVQVDYAIYTQEVDFGRINEARSADLVFDSQLEDVIVKLATSGCVTLDPAGRLVYSSLTDDGVVTSTVDSPLQNLAIYRELMLEGTLGESVTLPADWLVTAARSLGAASDKAGEVGVDMVVYVNQIMGLTESGVNPVLGTHCIQVKEEVMGVVQMVQKCFLDYSSYGYDRGATYGVDGLLPAPAYIPESAATGGWFEYLFEFDTLLHHFSIVQGEILSAVFDPLDGAELPASNIGAFAQAADDTRAVIEFMHSWPVPGDEADHLHATPVPCDVPADVYYDVYISEESGLQVPKRMVAGTEGREATVTVANAGPADATGTVMVTGVDLDGNFIGPFYRVVDGLPTEEILFAEPEEFVLPAGYSTSWTFFFSMDYSTKISWTATAVAEFDVIESNNTVTEETIVTGPRGGGGGGHDTVVQ